MGLTVPQEATAAQGSLTDEGWPLKQQLPYFMGTQMAPADSQRENCKGPLLLPQR